MFTSDFVHEPALLLSDDPIRVDAGAKVNFHHPRLRHLQKKSKSFRVLNTLVILGIIMGPMFRYFFNDFNDQH